MVPVWINTLTLAALGLLHLYWAFGGRWGWNEALPEQDGVKVLTPHAVDCLLVALGLLGVAALHLHKIGWQPLALPGWLDEYGLAVMGGIFLLRAIGDFRYVGFFKRIRSSRFARLDTLFYSPLCLILSLNILWLHQLTA